MSDKPNGRVGRVILLGGDGFEPMDARTGRFQPSSPPEDWLDARDRRVPVYGPDGKGPPLMIDPLESAAYPGQRARPGEKTRVQELKEQGCVVRWPARDADPDAPTESRPRCHICGARFPTAGRLARHVQVHHPDAPPPPPPPAEEPEPPEPVPVEPDAPEPAIGRDGGYDGRVMPWHGFRGV